MFGPLPQVLTPFSSQARRLPFFLPPALQPRAGRCLAHRGCRRISSSSPSSTPQCTSIRGLMVSIRRCLGSWREKLGLLASMFDLTWMNDIITWAYKHACTRVYVCQPMLSKHARVRRRIFTCHRSLTPGVAKWISISCYLGRTTRSLRRTLEPPRLMVRHRCEHNTQVVNQMATPTTYCKGLPLLVLAA